MKLYVCDIAARKGEEAKFETLVRKCNMSVYHLNAKRVEYLNRLASPCVVDVDELIRYEIGPRLQEELIRFLPKDLANLVLGYYQPELNYFNLCELQLLKPLLSPGLPVPKLPFLHICDYRNKGCLDEKMINMVLKSLIFANQDDKHSVEVYVPLLRKCLKYNFKFYLVNLPSARQLYRSSFLCCPICMSTRIHIFDKENMDGINSQCQLCHSNFGSDACIRSRVRGYIVRPELRNVF